MSKWESHIIIYTEICVETGMVTLGIAGYQPAGYQHIVQHQPTDIHFNLESPLSVNHPSLWKTDIITLNEINDPAVHLCHYTAALHGHFNELQEKWLVPKLQGFFRIRPRSF